MTKLVHKGVTLDDVVAQTGLSATTIKRRLALNGLCKEAKAVLTKGEITLSQAEALTLGSDEAQRSIIEEIARGDEFSAEGIRARRGLVQVFMQDQPDGEDAARTLEKLAYRLNHRRRDFRFAGSG